MGSGILQLLVTDRDTPQNGPPFSFHIVSGNEDKSFHIDQGGLLSISSPLRRRAKPQHLLKIQVKDFMRKLQLPQHVKEIKRNLNSIELMLIQTCMSFVHKRRRQIYFP